MASKILRNFCRIYESLELAEGSTVLTLTKELEEVKQQLEESRQQVVEKDEMVERRKEKNTPKLKQTKEQKSPAELGPAKSCKRELMGNPHLSS